MEQDVNESSKHISPLKAIRLKCLDCCCDQPIEVKLCTALDCPLWELRFGKNPSLKGKRKSNLHESH